MSGNLKIVTILGGALAVAIALRVIAGPMPHAGVQSVYADAKIGMRSDAAMLWRDTQLAARGAILHAD